MCARDPSATQVRGGPNPNTGVRSDAEVPVAEYHMHLRGSVSRVPRRRAVHRGICRVNRRHRFTRQDEHDYDRASTIGRVRTAVTLTMGLATCGDGEHELCVQDDGLGRS